MPQGLELAEMFADVGRHLLAAAGVDETLDLVVHLACAHIDGCDHAAVSWVVGRQILTAAATGDVPRRVDQIQYETDQGPCLDAIREREVFSTADLAAEGRWPDFATRAVEEGGIHSMISFRLFAEQDTMGALNLYSEHVDAFDDLAEAIGVVFAAHAAIALYGARAEENFERAVESRDVIGQAKGILEERRKLTAGEAFQVLRTASQDRNVRLREVATQLVETGTDPEDPGSSPETPSAAPR
jgi:transcriptional regulator with GAF, ATPase, and Fis domain